MFREVAMATGVKPANYPNGVISDIFRKIPSKKGNLPFWEGAAIKGLFAALFCCTTGMSRCAACDWITEELKELRRDFEELVRLITEQGTYEESIDDVDDFAEDEQSTGEEELRERIYEGEHRPKASGYRSNQSCSSSGGYRR